ncbi:MAG: sigma-70 family RNA polymerase sigma factor [Deltaproteobacteria bacterium]|nr:sigma-70 family RNA polymerase sigma factor [Deltaproteobacteria bacterium]MBI3294666.1 sigma-70 family RNA polymerase sigma factor [Deltaproteobacteria bacterium]
MGKGLKKWLKRLRAGDQSAFLPLYEKTAPGLMRFLLWKTNGDRATAEDILQESYVRFLLHLDTIESFDDVSVQSYLLRTVRNCLIDKVARSAHSRAIPVEDLNYVEDPTGATRAERAVELRELRVAMESLGDRESEIIWLRDALGLTHEEVASQVGISTQAARQAYVRAKRSLFGLTGEAYGVS